jgi:hypothetical protein
VTDHGPAPDPLPFTYRATGAIALKADAEVGLEAHADLDRAWPATGVGGTLIINGEARASRPVIPDTGDLLCSWRRASTPWANASKPVTAWSRPATR